MNLLQLTNKIIKVIEKIESDPESNDIKHHELNLWKKIYHNLVAGRRTGHGITALGDTLAALNFVYASDQSIEFCDILFKKFAQSILLENINLAKERGSFPLFDKSLEIDNPYLNRIFESFGDLKEHVINDYNTYGRRNISESTIAPTGSVSLLTQTSSGVEPVFSIYYKRRRKLNDHDKNVNFIDDVGDKWEEYNVIHLRFLEWYNIYCKNNNIEKKNIELISNVELEELIKLSPYHNACAPNINWKNRVKLQGTVQKWISHSISSTVNLPHDISIDEIDKIYKTAYTSKCKGITIYREGSRDGVLITKESSPKQTVDIFKENNAPKRGKELPCEIVRFTNKAELS